MSCLATTGIHLRYVVANPSSYLYPDDERPLPDGTFARFEAAACPRFNQWKYGLQGTLPAYVAQPFSVVEMTRRFTRQDVIYLLGTADNNPRADGLDRSCGAEAQGPDRYDRGLAFLARIRKLEPQTPHRLFAVIGADHHSNKLFSSACGIAALFDAGSCPATGTLLIR